MRLLEIDNVKAWDIRFLKTKLRVDDNSERELKLANFATTASSTNTPSRTDTFTERARASYWQRAPVVLSALHGNAEVEQSPAHKNPV